MDWTSVAVQAVVALTPVLSFVIVWALKLAWSKIPAAWLFIAAPLAGMLANYALSWIAGHSVDFSPLLGALLGAASIVLREFLTTIQTKGLTGPVSQTKGML